MASRQRVTGRVPLILGQASGLNPEAIPPTKAKLLYNFYVQNGMARKIPGSSLYLATNEGSSPIRWLSHFRRRAMFQISGKVLIETAEGSQASAVVSSDLDTDTIRSDRWRDKIYLANGKQLKFYDGTILSDLGLLPPGNGRTPRESLVLAEGFPNPGDPALGTYKYMVTFFDADRETESLPNGSLPDERGLFNSAEFDAEDNPLGWISSSITTTVSARDIIVQFSVAFRNYIYQDLSSRVTHLRLYRAYDSGSGFSDYQLVASFPRDGDEFSGLGLPTGTGYRDALPQTDAGATYIAEDLIPPPTRLAVINAGASDSARGPKFVRFWRDSLFLFGSDFPEYTVTDSATDISDKNFASDAILYASDTFLPEYYPFNYEIGRGDGQAPTGLAVVSDILCIFKERSIYTLVGTSINNFIPKIQDEVRGCIAPGSLQETPFGALFLSSAGVARFKGAGSAEIISHEIFDEIQRINREALSVITSSYDPDEEVYTLFVPQGTGTENNRELRFSLKDNAWTVARRARDISAATVIPKEDGPQKSLVSTVAGGFILDVSSRETVSDYDGQRITAIYRSAQIDFGDRENQKRVTWLYITARSSINWIVDVAIYAEDGQSAVFELENVDSEADYAVYASSSVDPDVAIYDVDRYVGQQTEKKLKIPVYGIGRYFSVEITERSQNSERHSFDLMSVELEAVMLTR